MSLDKKNSVRTILVLTSVLFLAPVSAEALVLPEDSSVFDREAAVSLLEICTGHEKKRTAAVFEKNGISVIRQKNYSKPSKQIDHTSAYTIGRGKIKRGAKTEDAWMIAVRGTEGSEWFSNFDFCPSADDGSHFVGGFLSSAEDVLIDLVKIINEKNPLIVIAGHSRGGAVANILAVLLNQIYDPKKIYAYTFASPMTIRNLEGVEDRNIFNVINPCDIVPKLPYAAWGFKRPGTDIILDDESEKINAAEMSRAVSEIFSVCPDAQSYYNARHSLEQRGLSGTGLTMYEIMTSLATKLSKLTSTNLELDMKDFQIPSYAIDSDFSTLIYYLSWLFKNNGEGFSCLLNEHLPGTYAKKIEKMKR